MEGARGEDAKPRPAPAPAPPPFDPSAGSLDLHYTSQYNSSNQSDTSQVSLTVDSHWGYTVLRDQPLMMLLLYWLCCYCLLLLSQLLCWWCRNITQTNRWRVLNLSVCLSVRNVLSGV